MIPIYEPHLRFSHKRAAIRQILSGWIGPGDANSRFTALLGAMHDRYCTVTNSGTSALMLAYLALDLPAGSVICCPDYGLPASHNAARLLGYSVQLVDVDVRTGCMNINELEKLLNKGVYGAVVFVDHNGYTGEDLRRVRVLCTAQKIPLIEDSAVALGCERAGRIGDLSILSFSVPKIITTGQGGAVMTSRRDLGDRLAELVDQGGGGWRHSRIHNAVGGNFRMADVQASLGVAQLNDLSYLLKRRHQLWDWYREGMEIAQDVQPSGWMMTTMGKNAVEANRIIVEVNKVGFDCKRLYQPVHRNTPYRGDDASFPGSCELYERLLYLPSSLNLSKKQVQVITSAVKRGRT